jgi:hypothetical protein
LRRFGTSNRLTDGVQEREDVRQFTGPTQALLGQEKSRKRSKMALLKH